MTEALSPSAVDVTANERPNGADRLVRRMTIIATAADAAIMLLIGELIPPLAVFVAVTIGLFVALRRRPAGLTIGLAVLALVANLGGVPFWSADLLAPGDTVAFLWAVLSAGGRFVVLAAAFVARREPVAADRAGRLLGAGAIGLLVVAVAASVVARVTAESVEAASGDATTAIAEFDFADEPIVVASGGTLHVANEDPARHTFTVVGTDISPMLLGGVGTRVTVDLAPGTYDVICEVPGHDAMAGTLEVQ